MSIEYAARGSAIFELADLWEQQRLYSGSWWAKLMELRPQARRLIELEHQTRVARCADAVSLQGHLDRFAEYEKLDRMMAGGYDEYQRHLAAVHAIDAKYQMDRSI